MANNHPRSSPALHRSQTPNLPRHDSLNRGHSTNHSRQLADSPLSRTAPTFGGSVNALKSPSSPTPHQAGNPGGLVSSPTSLSNASGATEFTIRPRNTSNNQKQHQYHQDQHCYDDNNYGRQLHNPLPLKPSTSHSTLTSDTSTVISKDNNNNNNRLSESSSAFDTSKYIQMYLDPAASYISTSSDSPNGYIKQQSSRDNLSPLITSASASHSKGQQRPFSPAYTPPLTAPSSSTPISPHPKRFKNPEAAFQEAQNRLTLLLHKRSQILERGDMDVLEEMEREALLIAEELRAYQRELEVQQQQQQRERQKRPESPVVLPPRKAHNISPQVAALQKQTREPSPQQHENVEYDIPIPPPLKSRAIFAWLDATTPSTTSSPPPTSFIHHPSSSSFSDNDEDTSTDIEDSPTTPTSRRKKDDEQRIVSISSALERLSDVQISDSVSMVVYRREILDLLKRAAALQQVDEEEEEVGGGVGVEDVRRFLERGGAESKSRSPVTEAPSTVIIPKRSREFQQQQQRQEEPLTSLTVLNHPQPPVRGKPLPPTPPVQKEESPSKHLHLKNLGSASPWRPATPTGASSPSTKFAKFLGEPVDYFDPRTPTSVGGSPGGNVLNARMESVKVIWKNKYSFDVTDPQRNTPLLQIKRIEKGIYTATDPATQSLLCKLTATTTSEGEGLTVRTPTPTPTPLSSSTLIQKRQNGLLGKWTKTFSLATSLHFTLQPTNPSTFTSSLQCTFTLPSGPILTSFDYTPEPYTATLLSFPPKSTPPQISTLISACVLVLQAMLEEESVDPLATMMMDSNILFVPAKQQQQQQQQQAMMTPAEKQQIALSHGLGLPWELSQTIVNGVAGKKKQKGGRKEEGDVDVVAMLERFL
ncbi:hypothetical protein HDV05_007848 [Chytridiales sp. JEL 0842]|nr:hypothetical protein HDV05_007848 [Chytridiales sp. JEL 0842]